MGLKLQLLLHKILGFRLTLYYASGPGLLMGICWDPYWSNTGLVQQRPDARSSNFDSRLSYALADQGFKLATPDTGFFPRWLGNTYQPNMPLQPSRVDRSPWSV